MGWQTALESLTLSLGFRLTDAATGRQLGGNLAPSGAAFRTQAIAFGGENWSLELAPLADFWRPKQSRAAQATLGILVLAVFLVCISVLGAAGRSMALHREVRARRDVEESLRHLNANLEIEVVRRTAELTENERQFRATFDVAAVGISHISVEGRVLRVNPRLCEITGYSEAELLHSWGDELTHPEDRPRAAVLIARLLGGEIPDYALENRYLRKDASTVWVRTRGSVARDDAGKVLYRVLICEDIDSERAASDLRAASEKRYRDLFEGNPLPMWTYDRATLALTAVNAAAVRHYGYSREEFLTLNLYDLRPAEEAHLLERELRSRRLGLDAVSEVRHRKKDGAIIVVEVTSHDIEYEGRPGRLVLANDITERKRASTLLNAQKDILERMAAGAPLEESLDKLVRLVEDVGTGSLCSVLLLEPGGDRLRHGAAPNLPEEYVRAIDGARIGPSAGSCGTAAFRREFVVVPDIASDPLWADYRDLALAHGLRACWSVPIRDAQGAVLGTFAAYSRTPRRPSASELELLATLTHTAAIAISQTRATWALYESEARFRATFELAALGIEHVGADGHFLRVNPRLCEISGYDEAELLRLGPGELVAAEDLAADSQQRSRLWRGEIENYSIEKRYKRKDGRLVWTNATISPVRDRSGRIEYTLGILEDISWRKAAEAELQQHQEMNRLLLENLAEGVVACDAEGKLILFNKTARDWHGADPREIPSEQWAEYYDLCEADGRTPLALDQIPLMRAFRGERVLSAEMSINRKGTPPRLVLASGAPLLDAKGEKHGAVVVMHDVTERERGERRFAAIFEFAPDAIIMADSAGVIRQVNRQAETLFGWSRHELVDKPVETLMPGSARAGHVGLREGFMRSAKPRAMGTGQSKLLGQRKDGTTFPIDISLSPMESPDGPMVAAAVRDTTERVRALQELERAAVELKQANSAVEHERASLAQRVAERTAELTTANEALVIARDAAEAASRGKSTFLATVSHEIRTPMNGVLGAIELLDRTGLDQKRAALLDTAHSSARSLLGLLNDLLDMAKIEAGRIEILPTPVSLEAVVNQVVSIHLPVAITKSIKLETRIDPGLPTWMAADALRLRQILGNLVSNAVKFTLRGGVELRVASRPLRERLHEVQFTVRDSGDGIPAEVLQTLFKPFEQGTAELARKSGGTGLGLAICRGLAERMGGSVELASEPGKGSTATLWLNLEEAEAPAHSGADHESSREAIASFIGERAADSARGFRVLVVDDHPTNRLLMVRQLEQLGVVADAASDGVDALERLRQGHHELIITDCEMPRLDGYQLAQAVRSEGGRLAGLPIIACTAHALPEVALRCRNAGMDEVLTKPIEMADLAIALRKHWPVTPPEMVVREESRPRTETALDRSKLSRIASTPEMRADLLAAFRADLATSMSSLEEFSSGTDYAASARFAHRSKGACLTVGATALAEAFAALEKSARGSAPAVELRKAALAVVREYGRLEEELSKSQELVSQ